MRTRQSTDPASNRQRSQRVTMAPRRSNWSDFFTSELKASADFMADVGRLRVQERVVNATPAQKVEQD